MTQNFLGAPEIIVIFDGKIEKYLAQDLLAQIIWIAGAR
jgi:hypothetical protein